ncbi:hypothetical protein GCK72_012372 [Caenorhabditis remanei]|uniref:Uncharacterized protein n=1 Tax=Caenorhabditis remanei TaxID=31234 RepID=A0A6A5GNF7_CAERE|nr:hypothetical protein GCK72_012372 [Caenorhabditis remanei]KAF1755919.1 hypothetical protein GCK72_012372 [Caenorhabditis remanei]
MNKAIRRKMERRAFLAAAAGLAAAAFFGAAFLAGDLAAFLATGFETFFGALAFFSPTAFFGLAAAGFLVFFSPVAAAFFAAGFLAVGFLAFFSPVAAFFSAAGFLAAAAAFSATRKRPLAPAPAAWTRALLETPRLRAWRRWALIWKKGNEKTYLNNVVSELEVGRDELEDCLLGSSLTVLELLDGLLDHVDVWWMGGWSLDLGDLGWLGGLGGLSLWSWGGWSSSGDGDLSGIRHS